ncbi:hypothetical protein V8C35DRAFT_314752 [Trichoderma chlorosporum]
MATLIMEEASTRFTDMNNTRLEISPYATPSVTLQLKDASRLYLPAHLLSKSPKLSTSDEDGIYHLDIPHDVAHVLVHYLFTDTYQCLRPQGSSMNEQLVAEFLTSIRVYIIARDYQLPSLEELAQAEITRLGDEFRIPLIFDLVQKAYPNPSWNDKWLCQYLKGRLSILFKDPKELLEWDPVIEQQATTISDILLKNMLELLRENNVSSHKLTNGTHEVADLPLAHSASGQSIEPLNSTRSEVMELITDKSLVENGATIERDNNADENSSSAERNDIRAGKDGVDPAKSGIDTEEIRIDTYENHVNLAKNDANLANEDNVIGKSNSNTSKSDDEATRNGIHTPASKSSSGEPDSSKGDPITNGLGVKAVGDKKEEKDFWGLSLKKKKKKKAAKGLVPESLQEGVAVKT